MKLIFSINYIHIRTRYLISLCIIVSSLLSQATQDSSVTPSDTQFKNALSCINTKQYDLALEHLNTLATLHPTNLNYVFQRANVLNILNRSEQALTEYLSLHEQHPLNPAIAYNIAYTLKKLGRISEAIPYYKKALEQKPLWDEAHFSLGLAYLTIGDFQHGWPLYEWRFKRTAQRNRKRIYPQPLWDGSPLHGKRIFLYAEQGLGDTFEFIRFAHEAKKRGGYVIVGVQKPVITIIKSCPFIDQVIILNQATPQFDVYAPLMSLPYILKTTINTIPHDIPYLYANAELTAKWKTKIDTLSLKTDSHTPFNIGICWQGSSGPSSPGAQSVAALRSIHYNHFAPLATIDHVHLYTLQQKTDVDQLNAHPNIHFVSFEDNFDQEHGRFADTAAVIKNLDLVITIDTSIGHLAAALGTPTWILLPNPADWRWMLHRNDSPWYPNVRLFRQSTSGDWNSVIHDVMHALKQEVRIKKQTMKNNQRAE